MQKYESGKLTNKITQIYNKELGDYIKNNFSYDFNFKIKEIKNIITFAEALFKTTVIQQFAVFYNKNDLLELPSIDVNNRHLESYINSLNASYDVFLNNYNSIHASEMAVFNSNASGSQERLNDENSGSIITSNTIAGALDRNRFKNIGNRNIEDHNNRVQTYRLAANKEIQRRFNNYARKNFFPFLMQLLSASEYIKNIVIEELGNYFGLTSLEQGTDSKLNNKIKNLLVLPEDNYKLEQIAEINKQMPLHLFGIDQLDFSDKSIIKILSSYDLIDIALSKKLGFLFKQEKYKEVLAYYYQYSSMSDTCSVSNILIQQYIIFFNMNNNISFVANFIKENNEQGKLLPDSKYYFLKSYSISFPEMYLPEVVGKQWHCICGFKNNDSQECLSCSTKLSVIEKYLSLNSEEFLKTISSLRHEEKVQVQIKQRKAEEIQLKKNKRNKKILKIVSIILFIVVLAVIGFFFLASYYNTTQYKDGFKLEQDYKTQEWKIADILGDDTEIHFPITFRNKPIEKIDIHLTTSITNTNIEKIYINSNIKEIRSYSFNKMPNLKEVIFEDNSKVVSLDSSTFSGNPLLHTIKLPTSLETIGEFVFDNNPNLKNITLPTTVKSIGMYAFTNLPSLEYLLIPNSVESIDEHVFFRTPNLKLFSSRTSLPSGWHRNYKDSDTRLYLNGQWKPINGIPTPN